MPVFKNLPLGEAAEAVGRGKPPCVTDEYVERILSLPAGEACSVEPAEGEDMRRLRMRLGAAARKTGRRVIIRRSGDKIYFWVEDRTLEKVEHSSE